MRSILLFGAGKSATMLIDYLLNNAQNGNWKLTIADANLDLAKSKIAESPNGIPVCINVESESERREFIQKADLVISMLPPHLHILVAKDCITFGKNLLTASYVNEEIKVLSEEIARKNLLFLYEMGLDPGIDHMSAIRILDQIRSEGGRITSFKSHCGGLVAPESDDNPWHYKISWNPRNVVTAGRDGAIFIQDGEIVKLNQKELFSAPKSVLIKDLGALSFYPNRDSLSYAPIYGLHKVNNLQRTTLRYPSFITGWNGILELGLTDDNPIIETKNKTVKEVWAAFENKNTAITLTGELETQLNYLGRNDSQTIFPMEKASAAQFLQWCLESKLALNSADRDMIVMLHEIEYELEGSRFLHTSQLVVKGKDQLHTAMAATVGLPLAIVAELILENKIQLKGLLIPTMKEIYEPVLEKLSALGISFYEEVHKLS
jgi:saccharopine dehydrogenase (NADP+, L-glutamate forming)